MGVMQKMIVIMGAVLLASPLAYASDVYISQNGGSASCGADGQQTTQSVSWFNSNANGGNTYHMCGAFTGSAGSTMLTPKSGSSGSPLTISFESGATFTAPYWSSNGAIYLNGVSYVTVNGQGQGTITATANGTNLANHEPSTGVYLRSCSNVTVEGLTISGMYMNDSSNGDSNGQNSWDVHVAGSSSNIRITGNQLNDAGQGIQVEFDGATDSGIELDHNTIADHRWGIAVSAGDAGSVMKNCLIHDNDISNWTNWQNPYHTDGVIAYGSVNQPVSFYIYNNYIHGDLGAYSPTAFVYITTDGNSSSSSTAYIYNNLFVVTGEEGFWAPVWLGSYTYNNLIANNTFVGTGSGMSMQGIVLGGGSYHNTGNVIENNIFENMARAIYNYSSGGSGITTCDYNDYYNLGSTPFVVNDGSYVSYSAWQGYGLDSHSITGNPNLNSSYIPNSGSPVISAGAGLTSEGITTLDSDKAGVARPSTGAWGIGAYQYPANTTPLSAPSGLHLIQ